VAILCTLSKVLKTVAKEDLEAFKKEHNILPTSQHGFRKGRSCTTALATAHAAWVAAKARGKVVAVVGFDLSTAFDSVGREDLQPKMEAMGIGGRNLKWFRCYLTGVRQRVVWDGQVYGHCLPVVARPRLLGSTAATPESLAQVQVAVNNVSRSVVGCRRKDHFTIVDLLEAAKYLSLNQQAVKATAMSAWTSFQSCDGASGTRNPVGDAMFSGAELPTARASRSATAGEVRVRTRGLDTHVTHGLEV
jgi:hypothetical protein